MKKLKKWSTEKVSRRVFYLLVTIIVALYVLFLTVGYNLPYLPNPQYNAPLLTGALIVAMEVITAAAVGVAVWAGVRSVRNRGAEANVTNNIPSRRIVYIVVLATALLLAVTYIAGSAHPLTANGAAYAEAGWLKVADMFINTSMALMVIAIGAMVFGATRYYRKGRGII